MHEAQYLAGQRQRPPGRAPGQQELTQALQADAIEARLPPAARQAVQAPGTDLRGQAEYSWGPETGVCQW